MAQFGDENSEIWFDGAWRKWHDATIHVLTHGLHYGSCVFEGTRVYGGKIFKGPEHNARLLESARIMRMTSPYGLDELNAACAAVVARNQVGDGSLRPVIWRGSEDFGIAGKKTKIHVAVAAWDWPNYFHADAQARGLRFMISPWRRPPAECAPVHAKAAGLYMICTLSKQIAEEEGWDDALMLDYEGRICESTGTNIFFIRDNKLHTPKPDNFLNGITRQTVMDLARVRGLAVVERVILPDELASMDEVFITGTAAEIVPVGEIAGHKYSVGPITQMLRQDYMALVRAG